MEREAELLVEPAMDLITDGELQSLLSLEGEPCLSVYVPTCKRGTEVQQGAKRMKNLLRRAEEGLRGWGLRAEGREKFLAPLWEKVNDARFWRYQSEGVAFFATSGGFWTYRLSLEVPEHYSLGRRCYLTPLLPLFGKEEPFYVLALDKSGVQLYRGGRYTLEEVALEDVPLSLAEVLGENTLSRLQMRGISQAPSGEKGAMLYHGQGAAGDKAQEKKDILRFFRQLDNGVYELLGGQNVPLVLAGIDSLCGLYREANHYSQLKEEAVGVHPRELSRAELHQRAWEIVAPTYQEPQEEAKEQLQRYEGKQDKRVSKEIEEIVPAACFQRVDTLFLHKEHQLWGRFDSEECRVEVHEKPQTGDEELFNLAALYTLQNGGEVYAVSDGEWKGEDAVALLRY